MAINMAQKRFRKAQRQKQLVALARKADAVHATPAARVARAAQAPIQACYLTESLFEFGMGTLVLARGATSVSLALSIFLLDTFSLGIKDVMFDQVDGEALDRYIEKAGAAAPFVEVDPSYARKLLCDLAAWSKSLGFAPHRDFATVERIFGDVRADDSDATFQFGQGGKPVYISGPRDSADEILLRTAQLQKALGSDSSDLIT